MQWVCLYVTFNQTTAIRKTVEDISKKSNIDPYLLPTNSNSNNNIISDKVDIYFKHINVRLNDQDIYIIVNLIRAKLNIPRKSNNSNNKKSDRNSYVNLKNLKRIISKVYDHKDSKDHDHQLVYNRALRG